ncbi:MAG TPA: UbiA family prenyltransferase [Methanomassiliicoccales archaeon]|jgi:4-hydroxybenzoate polyprenyltransferase
MPASNGGTAWEKFSAKGDGLIAFLEKERLPIIGVFVYVILLALGRDMAEYYLLDAEFVNTVHPWIFSIAHHVSFYVVVFLGLVLLLTAFSGRGFRRSLNLITNIYWLILIPPFLDHFVFGLNESYAYFSWTEYLNAFFQFRGRTFHPGQGLEVAAFLFALFAYVIWTQRNSLFFIKERAVTLLRVFFLVLFTIISMFIVATPGAYLPVGNIDGMPAFPYFDQTKYFQFHLFLVMYYVVAGLLLVTVIAYMAMKGSFRRQIASMRPFQTLFFGMIVAGGMVVGWRTVDPELVMSITQTPYWVNITYVILSIASALPAWQVSTIWNDIADSGFDDPTKTWRTIASGTVDRGTMFQGSIVMMLVALMVALLLSFTEFLLLALIFVLSYLYSFKPVRFKEQVMSPALIGIGASLAFLYGYLTPYTVVVTQYQYDTPVIFLTGAVGVAPLSLTSFMIAAVIFLGLVIGSMVTDVSGYEEDKKANVRTVYTKLGLGKGALLVSALILVASFTPLVLFSRPTDLVLFPVMGVVAAGCFYRYRSSRLVMGVALIGFIYATLRYLGMI